MVIQWKDITVKGNSPLRIRKMNSRLKIEEIIFPSITSLFPETLSSFLSAVLHVVAIPCMILYCPYSETPEIRSNLTGNWVMLV